MLHFYGEDDLLDKLQDDELTDRGVRVRQPMPATVALAEYLMKHPPLPTEPYMTGLDKQIEREKVEKAKETAGQ